MLQKRLQYEINFIVVISRTWFNPIYLSLVSDGHEHCIDNKPHVSRPKTDIRLSSIEQSCQGSSRPSVRIMQPVRRSSRSSALKPIPIGILAAGYQRSDESEHVYRESIKLNSERLLVSAKPRYLKRSNARSWCHYWCHCR